MQKRAILTLAVFLAGCTRTYDVPVEAAAPIWPGGSARLVEGGKVEIQASYKVRAQPFPGEVLSEPAELGLLRAQLSGQSWSVVGGPPQARCGGDDRRRSRSAPKEE